MQPARVVRPPYLLMNIYKNYKIKSVTARKILNSQGKPTIEVSLKTEKGVFKASVPSGVSRGKYEAVEVRVKKAIKNIREKIQPELKDLEPAEQNRIDNLLIKLDSTRNKSFLGGNSIVGVSMAVSRAGASSQNLPLWKWLSLLSKTRPRLPLPSILFMEGGLHGKGNFDIQEIMAVFPARSFKESFSIGRKVFQRLKSILKAEYGKSAVELGAEGAFTPALEKTKDALDLLMRAAGGQKIGIILDAAASTFFKKGKYHFEGRVLARKELLNFYKTICRKYPILAIEDPFSEEDWLGFHEIVKVLGRKIFIIGDDLTVTNIERIKKAKSKRACNGIILKPNQIGTVSEAIAAAKLAESYGWKAIVSHRGGDTQDDFISDFVAGIGADFIKAGAPTKKERVAKYNRLLRIEEELK